MKMSKPKKVDYKKTLVRNPQRPVPKSKVTLEESRTSLKNGLSVKSVEEDKNSLVRNPQRPVSKSKVSVRESRTSLEDGLLDGKLVDEDKAEDYEPKSGPSGIRLDSVEPYSTLRLSKEIDEIIKPRKTKSCSDVDKNKLALDEKVSRRVNIPYDQPIYKDLMPLTCRKVSSQTVIASRPPLPPKDKEPVLADFVKPREPCECYYIPEIPKSKPMEPIITSNPLRLYYELHKY